MAMVSLLAVFVDIIPYVLPHILHYFSDSTAAVDTEFDRCRKLKSKSKSVNSLDVSENGRTDSLVSTSTSWRCARPRSVVRRLSNRAGHSLIRFFRGIAACARCAALSLLARAREA